MLLLITTQQLPSVKGHAYVEKKEQIHKETNIYKASAHIVQTL